MKIETCPLCVLGCESGPANRSEQWIIRCRRCGEYAATETLLATSLLTERLTVYLSAHTRQETESGRRSVLTTTNLEDLAESHRSASVRQKIGKLITYVSRQTHSAGVPVKINQELDFPLCDAVDSAELRFLWTHLMQEGYFVNRQMDAAQLTVKGWDYIAPPIGGVPGRCFVAMSFDPSLENAWLSGIQPAIEVDCDMDAVRIDYVHHNEKICDRILGEIRAAQFVVADFTMQRAGVYFEAGFAKALGREVIWTCRANDFANLHFDTRQYNHLKWEDPIDLRVKLADRIRATAAGTRRVNRTI